MKKNKLNSGNILVAPILGVSQILIVVAMMMSFSQANTTVSQANYARFAQEFGEYSEQVKIQAADTKVKTASKGIAINNAQKFHMVANGFDDVKQGDNQGTYGMRLPVGYELPASIKNIFRYSADEIVAYRITDLAIEGYETKEDLNFYGDANGEEYHLVTSDGIVFTIPGFPEKQEDGSIRYYINSQGYYYTVIGTSDKKESVAESIEKDPIVAKDFVKMKGVTLDNKIVTKSPVYGEKLDKIINKEEHTEETFDNEFTEEVKNDNEITKSTDLEKIKMSVMTAGKFENLQIYGMDYINKLYDLNENICPDGFLIIDDNKDNYQEIAVIKLDDISQTMDIFTNLIKRTTKLKENKDIEKIVTNNENVLIAQNNGMIIFIISSNRPNIEEKIYENF